MKYSSKRNKSLREAWQKRAAREQDEKDKLRRDAMLKAAAAATHLKEKYKVKSVYLYGSLARGTHFDHRSDIDLMVEEFPAEANYWRMLVEMEEIAAPVEVNVVLSEDASPGLRDKARREGKLL
ncbi:nucleotidyltransferase family protein [Desulfotruncus alcoholivorax]|uniref:nucleotidyltransferase family protein n=1 Tax=Desulfotruncus alcoholivorax TaxID=265477 RepID=UPI00041B8BBA|nr:nucleotidyltransferase domain-containing protein [Desulfotruncus alcoholivorax]